MGTVRNSTAFDRIPVEVWEQIIHALPVNSLASFVLSCRKFHRCANSFLYRTICFPGRLRAMHSREYANPRTDQETCFGVHRAQSWLYHSHRSLQMMHMWPFLKAITSNPKLRSHVVGASFWMERGTCAEDLAMAEKCLEYLKPSLRLLHLVLSDFDSKLALTTNVTFLDIGYPHEKLFIQADHGHHYDADLHRGLRDNVHAIFCIPTLRHLSLRNARTWQAFHPISPPNMLRVGTSSIVSLSLPKTVPLSRDLAEILTWPRALRYFDHENELGDNILHFQVADSEHDASPEIFINGLYPQRNSIEELIYANEETQRTNDKTAFGTTLRDFPQLKRLAVSRTCLLRDWQLEDPNILYEKLPPKLEELWIFLESEDTYEEEDIQGLKQALREIAINKERCYPFLMMVVLRGRGLGHHTHVDEYPAAAERTLAELDVLSIFEAVGVQIEFTFGIEKEYGYGTEMSWKLVKR